MRRVSSPTPQSHAPSTSTIGRFNMSTTEPAPQPAVRWHATLPNPQITVPFIQPAALAEIIASDNLEAGKDYLIVDVRRTDFEVCAMVERTHEA